MFKYNEDKYIAELTEYVKKTYEGHYVGEDNVQALDLIFAAGHGEGFCIGDILKYGSRYGKKAGKNRKDLVKILHYALLMLHVHDKEQEQIAKNRVYVANNAVISEFRPIQFPHIPQFNGVPGDPLIGEGNIFTFASQGGPTIEDKDS